MRIFNKSINIFFALRLYVLFTLGTYSDLHNLHRPKMKYIFNRNHLCLYVHRNNQIIKFRINKIWCYSPLYTHWSRNSLSFISACESVRTSIGLPFEFPWAKLKLLDPFVGRLADIVVVVVIVVFYFYYFSNETSQISTLISEQNTAYIIRQRSAPYFPGLLHQMLIELWRKIALLLQFWRSKTMNDSKSMHCI